MWLVFVTTFFLLAGTPSASAQSYPNRPIRIVVPTQAGAAQDILARLMQPHLEKALGQPVIVENRSGASTMIGTDTVAKAAPDGHTLLIVPTTFTVNAALNSKLNFDLERDFEPIAVLVKNPLLFAVNAKVPANSLKEFVALAKAKPGSLNYGSSGASTQAHLLLEMWSAQAGIKMQHVPYRGGAPAMNDLMGGQIPVLFDVLSGAAPFIKAGSIRTLAVTTKKRSPSFPDIPTIAESGLPDYETYTWNAVFGPPGMAPALAERLSAEFRKAVADPDVAKQLRELSGDPVGSTGAELEAQVKAEGVKWGPIIQAAGLKAE